MNNIIAPHYNKKSTRVKVRDRFFGRTPYKSTDFSAPKEVGPCYDCGVKLGELHRRGCEGERCPACGSQLISCGC